MSSADTYHKRAKACIVIIELPILFKIINNRAGNHAESCPV